MCWEAFMLYQFLLRVRKGLFISRHVFRLLLPCNGQIYKSSRWSSTMTLAVKGRRAGSLCKSLSLRPWFPAADGACCEMDAGWQWLLIFPDSLWALWMPQVATSQEPMESQQLLSGYEKYIVVPIHWMYIIGNYLVVSFELYIIFSTKLILLL